MERAPASMAELQERIIAWADAAADVRGVLLVGSQARIDRPADEWSDLDLVLIATDPDRYLDSTEWLVSIAPVWVSFVEGTIVRTRERRVLFEGARDVDFNFFTPDQFRQIFHARPAAAVLHRGARVLVDKDGFFPPLPPPAVEAPAVGPPSEAEFLAIVNEFWYRAVWAAKKLRRGELYIALGQCNGTLLRLLREILERHARASRGWQYDTWHDGRFFDQWADPRALSTLREAYARYDAADIRRSLSALMALFDRVAMETAERLGFNYPAAAPESAREWVTNCLAEGQG